MGVVVHGVDAPGIPRALMRRMADAIEHGIAQIDVAGRHVDLRAQHGSAILEVPGAHSAKELQVLHHAAISMGARHARLGQRSALRTNFFIALAVDVRITPLDEFLGERVQPLEVVGGVGFPRVPIEAEPANVASNGLDKAIVLPERVRVVHTQEGAARKSLRDAEIQADRLHVPDVEKAVRLRREPGDHLRLVLAGVDVATDDLFYEMLRTRCARFNFAHGDSGLFASDRGSVGKGAVF